MLQPQLTDSQQYIYEDLSKVSQIGSPDNRPVVQVRVSQEVKQAIKQINLKSIINECDTDARETRNVTLEMSKQVKTTDIPSHEDAIDTKVVVAEEVKETAGAKNVQDTST